MRRLLAPIVFAAALVGAAAPSASAEACYGAEGIAKLCFDGALVSTGEAPVGTCLYTGGTTCTPYYVDAPSVSAGDVQLTEACAVWYCFTNEELSELAQTLYCRVDSEPYYCNE